MEIVENQKKVWNLLMRLPLNFVFCWIN